MTTLLNQILADERKSAIDNQLAWVAGYRRKARPTMWQRLRAWVVR